MLWVSIDHLSITGDSSTSATKNNYRLKLTKSTETTTSPRSTINNNIYDEPKSPLVRPRDHFCLWFGVCICIRVFASCRHGLARCVPLCTDRLRRLKFWSWRRSPSQASTLKRPDKRPRHCCVYSFFARLHTSHTHTHNFKIHEQQPQTRNASLVVLGRTPRGCF